MSGFRLTASQEAAVNARGDAVLVSAAAGSGKTRVLVERLMSYITDREDPKNIDGFLIITYTRAAAAELRRRITEELSRLSAENIRDRRLRRQATLCAHAQIGTIHSFCISVLRECGHLIGITPDFRVPDEDRADVLKAAALERLLESRYERIEEDEGFKNLVDTVGAGRDDSRLTELILDLHAKLQSRPYPERWAREQMHALSVDKNTPARETPWGAYHLSRAGDVLDYWSAELDALCQRLGLEPVGNYAASIGETAAAVRGLRAALDDGWNRARAMLPIPFPRLSTPKGMSDSETAVYAKSRREACRKAMGGLLAVFSAPWERLVDDLGKTAPAMRSLLELTLEFDAAYGKEKRRLGLLDFSDLEHLTARLLTDEETGARTWLAHELSGRFVEIMADEYQDVNRIQELILHAVSREGKNIFMVGDVKQSIYRFRLADPTIFLEKLNSFADVPPDADIRALKAPARILLQENFRSSAEVLDAANHIFENIMSTNLGEVAYDAGARLIPGRAGGEGKNPRCLLSVIAPPEAGDGDDAPGKQEAEAMFAAKRIAALLSSGERIPDAGGTRPLRPGDIAILLRSPGGSGAVFRQALASLGIPAEARQSGGFFRSPEISVMLSLLAVVDNPRQDVPLISVLRSPLFCFTPDELSAVRARKKTGDFYSALAESAREDEKCAGFIKNLASLRELHADLSVSELISHIYGQTGVAAVFGAMPDGAARRENLAALFEYARGFDSSGWRGLFGFTAWLRRLAERGEEPPAFASGSGDCVRIMSIHKSKGLEFPVVFLCDTARRFNKSDLQKTVLIHSELGLGPRITDTARGVEYPTPAFSAIKEKLELEALSEELRVLYVAATRARERLYITCAVKNPEETAEKLLSAMPAPLSHIPLQNAASSAQWLIRAALLPESPIELEFCRAGGEAEEISPVAAQGGVEHAAATDTDRTDELARRIGFSYPYPRAVEAPSKLTVTELKGRAYDAGLLEDSAALGPSTPTQSFRRPDFARDSRPLTGAERGTATHLVMRYIDLSRAGDAGGVRGEISRLRQAGFLSERQAEAADADAILKFFRSELGHMMRSADSLLREFRFSLLRPAEEFFPGCEGDEILQQGVVDCCIIRGGELTVLDFKTDYVTAATLEEKVASYTPQLRAYAEAMRRIMGKPAARAVLYFFHMGKAVTIEDI